jgi:hypothetical protein
MWEKKLPGLGEVGELAEAGEEGLAEGGVVGELPIEGIDQVERDFAGFFEDEFIADEIGGAEREGAVLADSEDVAGAAKFEIGFGDAKAVRSLFQGGEAL